MIYITKESALQSITDYQGGAVDKTVAREIIEGLTDAWIPCSERHAEPCCLACDKFGQVFVALSIVTVNGDSYDGTDYNFEPIDEFLRGKKTENKMRILPRKIIAWMPLPEPYKEEQE